MGFLSKFFGSKTQPTGGPTSNVSLQLLLDQWPEWSQDSIQEKLHSYDATLKSAVVGDVIQSDNGGLHTEIAWKGRKITLVGFDIPMPSAAVDSCLALAHYDPEAKEKARAHRAHLMAFTEAPQKQITAAYIDLALVIGALANPGGLAVVNESAQTSMPGELFIDPMDGMTRAQFFASMPPLYLYAGFAKFEVENIPGVWMTTRGLHVYGLPNLATHVDGHEFGTRAFEIFSNVAAYMMDKGPVLGPGHTMQIGDNENMRLREPTEDEEMLTGGHPLLIADFISADQVNKHIYK